jgi:hypothetical protein
MRFASDGATFFIQSGGQIVIANASGQVIQTLDGTSASWSPLGSIVSFRDPSGRLQNWDRDSRSTTSITGITSNGENVDDVPAGWNSDSLLFYIRSFPDDPGKAQLHSVEWNGQSDTVIWEGQLGSMAAVPILTTQGVWVLTDAGWVLLDLGGGKSDPNPAQYSIAGDPIASPFGSLVAYSDGGSLIVASAENPWIPFGSSIASNGGGFAFSPDGQSLVVADGSGLTIYGDDGSQIGHLDGSSLSTPGWSNDGIYFVDVTDGTLRRISPDAFTS